MGAGATTKSGATKALTPAAAGAGALDAAAPAPLAVAALPAPPLAAAVALRCALGPVFAPPPFLALPPPAAAALALALAAAEPLPDALEDGCEGDGTGFA